VKPPFKAASVEIPIHLGSSDGAAEGGEGALLGDFLGGGRTKDPDS
jgi:hypothetical protein